MAEDENKKFFDDISWCYDKAFGNWIINIQKRALKIIDIRDNSRILDAGCGSGNMLQLLEKRKNLSLYGIDISPKMIELAKSKLHKSKLFIMSVDKLEFKKNFFDYITSVDAFHHYPSPSRTISHIKSRLKKSGTLAVVDLDFGLFFNKLFSLIEPGNNGVGKKELMGLFRKNKFRNIKQIKVGLFTFLTIGQK